jgi:NAD(P)-dependent dehydrogenase (short-subunit alcohol dehydrogenase family)
VDKLGIGLEFVKLLQFRGCSVVIGDLQFTPEAKDLQVVQNGAGQVLVKETDVTNWRDLED